MTAEDLAHSSSAARIFDPPEEKPHDIYRCNWGLVAAGEDVITHRCSCGGFEGNSIGATRHADEMRNREYVREPFPKLRFAEGYLGRHL